MKDDDIFIYLMLIVIGYFIAKMFSRSSCNGFNVGSIVAPAPMPTRVDSKGPHCMVGCIQDATAGAAALSPGVPLVTCCHGCTDQAGPLDLNCLKECIQNSGNEAELQKCCSDCPK